MPGASWDYAGLYQLVGLGHLSPIGLEDEMNYWNELSDDDRLRVRIQGHPDYEGVFPVLSNDELVGWEANTQINQFIKGGKSLGIFYWPVDAAIAWNYWEAYHNADTPLKVSRGARRGLLLNEIRRGWTHD